MSAHLNPIGLANLIDRGADDRKNHYSFECASLLFSPSASFAQAPPAFALDMDVGLNAYQALVEEHLVGIMNGLKTLADTEEAASASWERIRIPLEEFSKNVPTQAAVWLAKSDGSYLTVEKGMRGESLKDRAYFSTLMSGKDVDGVLVVSKSTGERSIIVATPIVKNGLVIGALGASLSATHLAKRVSDKIGFPQNVVFYALDAEGQTALHRDSALIFEFPSDIGDQSLKSAVKEMLSEPKGSVECSFRDVRRTAHFQKSKATGWIFVLGVAHAS